MLSINDVTKIDEKRKQIKKEIYMKIYEQFSAKIKQSVELGHKQIFLTIPTFYLATPYLTGDLRRNTWPDSLN